MEFNYLEPTLGSSCPFSASKLWQVPELHRRRGLDELHVADRAERAPTASHVGMKTVRPYPRLYASTGPDGHQRGCRW
ncbi:hypothetical protein H072_7443 [Dactylellina haptotyla CBS 200.50]|uniref:Uncharacterized protein n=1 Tax=Dactylellina haptotyla (strain CBS 200.50) TaxID=1284197 RepID=S8A7Q0_DACHA|nr:hypothetical protein H072_7443 [Dactylellina haptotyla CBS 200.50]